jgi:hypothetical protein
MNNLVQKFNSRFFLFVTFIFLIAVYWLYQKHTVGNDSTISEWIINYQGAFTRRGIIGEISFQLADFFNLSLRFVIFLFQTFLYLVYSILIYYFIKNVPKNTLTIIAIISPLFLLYPIAEIEVLARKEIFLYVGFIIFLNLSNNKYQKNTPLIYIFFIFPILCLIWEPFFFFFSFAIYIILINNDKDSLKKISLKIILSFSSSILTLIIIILNTMTVDEHLLMSNVLMNRFGETCYMSCALLGSKTSIKAQYTAVFDLISLEVIFRYSMVVLIGFSALFILIFNTKLNDKLFFLNLQIFRLINTKNLFLTFVILLFPSLILAGFMTDWGRVVNMAYTFSILTYIYLIKNQLVIIKEKIFFFDALYDNKKKFFITLLIIYAFSWNPKTGMTGDIATNSLYKIIYNTSKKIFGFKSMRFFQDTTIIKFHRNYIE